MYAQQHNFSIINIRGSNILVVRTNGRERAQEGKNISQHDRFLKVFFSEFTAFFFLFCFFILFIFQPNKKKGIQKEGTKFYGLAGRSPNEDLLHPHEKRVVFTFILLAYELVSQSYNQQNMFQKQKQNQQ